MISTALVMYTIYESPADFPGQFVVRRWIADAGGVRCEAQPFALASSLAGVRRFLPRGLYPMARGERDDPAIVETWL